jgi:hypothetical protein
MLYEFLNNIFSGKYTYRSFQSIIFLIYSTQTLNNILTLF